MTSSIPLSESLEPYAELSFNTGLATAMKVMHDQQVTFAFISDTDRRLLIGREQLAGADPTDNITLADFFTPLPPIVTLSADWDPLLPDDIDQLVDCLIATETPGIVVYQDDEIKGILSSHKLAEGMSGESIRVSKGGRLGGDASVPCRIYICDECSSSIAPSTGEEIPPRCPQNVFHGSMRLGM